MEKSPDFGWDNWWDSPSGKNAFGWNADGMRGGV
jgi:hypothetical protein